MSATEEQRPRLSGPVLAALIALAVLFISGLVLALDELIDIPFSIVVAALIVAGIAALTLAGAAWAESRRRGLGILRGLGRSVRAVGRAVWDSF